MNPNPLIADAEARAQRARLRALPDIPTAVGRARQAARAWARRVFKNHPGLVEAAAAEFGARVEKRLRERAAAALKSTNEQET